MTFVLDDLFEWFLERNGQPDYSEPVSQAMLDQYRGVLPDRLLEYWQEHGFCRFMGGLFWIVNPADYQETMQSWLADTGILEEDIWHVIARTGFGDLMLWGQNNGNQYTIEASDGSIYQEKGSSDLISKGEVTRAIQIFFGIMSPDIVDKEDVDTDEPILFANAVKKFGALEPHEMFTFVPAVFMGGDQSLAAVEKVDLFIQLDILRNMTDLKIVDIHGLAKQAFGG